MTETPEVEEIARIIARRLGHNDETGMYWERYVLPARAIVEHYAQKAAGGEQGGEVPKLRRITNKFVSDLDE